VRPRAAAARLPRCARALARAAAAPVNRCMLTTAPVALRLRFPRALLLAGIWSASSRRLMRSCLRCSSPPTPPLRASSRAPCATCSTAAAPSCRRAARRWRSSPWPPPRRRLSRRSSRRAQATMMTMTAAAWAPLAHRARQRGGDAAATSADAQPVALPASPRLPRRCPAPRSQPPHRFQSTAQPAPSPSRSHHPPHSRWPSWRYPSCDRPFKCVPVFCLFVCVSCRQAAAQAAAAAVQAERERASRRGERTIGQAYLHACSIARTRVSGCVARTSGARSGGQWKQGREVSGGERVRASPIDPTGQAPAAVATTGTMSGEGRQRDAAL
jgi:hypothetical protein